jgi:hypothetical protein
MIRLRARRLRTGLHYGAVAVGVLCLGVGLLTGQPPPAAAGTWLVALTLFVRWLPISAPAP